MPKYKTYNFSRKQMLRALILTLSILACGSLLFAHGPKGHTEAFTSLAAAQNATMMYDKLVATGKLDESWETRLETIEVYKRNAGQREIVVKFSRASGEPRAVYIFFTYKGKYNGSNFTGE